MSILQVQQRTASGLTNVGQFPQSIVGSMGSAIIESGSNANGDYVKLADGTLICYNRKSIQLDTWISVGSLYIATTEEQTFPHIFTDTYYVMTGYSRWGNSFSFGMGVLKLSTSKYVCYPVESRKLDWSSLQTKIDVLAIGTWK